MRRAAIVAAALVAVSVAPAAAKPLDTASAHAGLRAYRAYQSSIASRAGAARKADAAFIASVKAACPKVLTSIGASDTFDQGDVVQFGKEAGADLVVAAFAPVRKPLATLSQRIGKLRWSRPSAGFQIQAALDAQRAVFELTPSDLCADAAALAANGGRAVPPGTAAFLKTYDRTTSVAGLDGLRHVLVRYRPASDRRLVRIVTRLERRADTRLEHTIGGEVPKLLDALGLTV
jgi:hypothetical protein